MQDTKIACIISAIKKKKKKISVPDHAHGASERGCRKILRKGKKNLFFFNFMFLPAVLQEINVRRWKSPEGDTALSVTTPSRPTSLPWPIIHHFVRHKSTFIAITACCHRLTTQLIGQSACVAWASSQLYRKGRLRMNTMGDFLKKLPEASEIEKYSAWNKRRLIMAHLRTTT